MWQKAQPQWAVQRGGTNRTGKKGPQQVGIGVDSGMGEARP